MLILVINDIGKGSGHWNYNYCGRTLSGNVSQNLKDAMIASGYNVGETIHCSINGNRCKLECDRLGGECSGFSVNTKNGNCTYQINNAPVCEGTNPFGFDDLRNEEGCLATGKIDLGTLSSTSGCSKAGLQRTGIGYGWNYFKRIQ